METLVDRKTTLKGLGCKQIMGKKVLTTTGFLVGRVFDLRLDEDKTVMGILIRRNPGQKKIYLDSTTISSISAHAIILERLPFNLLIGNKVFTHEGKYLGKVSEVSYKEELQSIKVRKFFGKTKSLPAEKLEIREKSILLRE